jgi:hypothetical protein
MVRGAIVIVAREKAEVIDNPTRLLAIMTESATHSLGRVVQLYIT